MALRLPRNVLWARRADLRHAHGDTATLLSLAMLRRPSVWTTHGLHLLRRSVRSRRHMLERAVTAAVRRCSLTICCSEAERDELLAIAPAFLHSRIRLVRNGVAAPRERSADDRMRTRRALGLRPDELACLYLGELSERKDPLTAARAVLQARRAGVPVVLLVAGDGPLGGELQRLGGPGIRMLGFRSDGDRLLAAADVFCLPSSREGISFAVLEAMAHGLPTVVAEGPGNNEAVADGAGLTVRRGDVPGLAAVLTELFADPARRASLGRTARRRARERFSLHAMLDGVSEVYRSALAHPT